MNKRCKGISSVSAARRRRHSFTLTELMLVILIMGILMGLAAPAFNKMALGKGPRAAATQVASVLQQARQYAIANRKKVAVIFPDGEWDDFDFSDGLTAEKLVDARDRPFQSVRVCHRFQTSPERYTYPAGTEWLQLPSGAIFYDKSADAAQFGGDFLTVDVDQYTGSTDDPNDKSVIFTDTPAIVFTPTGVLQNGGNVSFNIIEGVYDGSDVIVRSKKNSYTVTVNQFTGRVTVSE